MSVRLSVTYMTLIRERKGVGGWKLTGRKTMTRMSRKRREPIYRSKGSTAGRLTPWPKISQIVTSKLYQPLFEIRVFLFLGGFAWSGWASSTFPGLKSFSFSQVVGPRCPISYYSAQPLGSHLVAACFLRPPPGGRPNAVVPKYNGYILKPIIHVGNWVTKSYAQKFSWVTIKSLLNLSLSRIYFSAI